MDGAPQGRVFAAARQLFLNHGYAAVSMQQIADAVGIKKASLYYHFASKEDLYKAVIEAEVAGLLDGIAEAAAMQGPFPDLLEQIVRAALSSCDAEFGHLMRDYKAITHSGPGETKQLMGTPFDILRPAFERAMERGEIPPGPVDRAIGLLLAMTIWQIDQAETFPFAVMDTETAAKAIPTVLLNGLWGLESNESTPEGEAVARS